MIFLIEPSKSYILKVVPIPSEQKNAEPNHRPPLLSSWEPPWKLADPWLKWVGVSTQLVDSVYTLYGLHAECLTWYSPEEEGDTAFELSFHALDTA